MYADTLTENIVQWESILVGGGAILAAVGLPKLGGILKNFNLRKAVRKADKVLHNIDTLSSQTVAEAVKEGLSAWQKEFEKRQSERDQAAWEQHNTCHTAISTRLDSIDKHAVARAKEIKKIARDVTYIKGHLNLEKD